MTREEVAELHARWLAGDEAAGERLILGHLPLVRAIVARLAPPGCEREDLVQAGLLGLVRALRRFRPEAGVDLSTFAFPFVASEVREQARSWRVAGLSRRQWRTLARARREEARLRQELGREPAAAEVAAALGMEAEELVALLDACSPPAALDEACASSAPAAVDLDEALSLRLAMSWLSRRQRVLIALRYLAGRRQAEVAALLGVSQSQVSRLEGQALAALRRLLGESA